jgi:hypothetical protein
MTAGQLRATVPEVAVLSDCNVQLALQKDLKMLSRGSCSQNAVDNKGEEEQASFLQEVQALDGSRLGESNVFG